MLNKSALMGSGTVRTLGGRQSGFTGTWLTSLSHCLFLHLPPLPLNTHMLWKKKDTDTALPFKTSAGWFLAKQGRKSQVGGRADVQNDEAGRQNKRWVDECRWCTMGLMMGAWNVGAKREQGWVRVQAKKKVVMGVMSESVLGQHALNWDTGPIHAKNRFLHCQVRTNTVQSSPTVLRHSNYK